MRLLAAIALLFLTACGGPSLSSKQRDEVADEAADAAADAVAGDARVSEMRGEIEELEGRIKALETRDSYILNSLAEAHQGNVDNDKEIRRFMDHYNEHLRRNHGAAN